MPTDCLFREDAYLTSTPATVLGLTEKGGIVVDRTCFYATSGGQPGDSGMLVTPAGEFPLATAVYNDALKTEIAHVPAEGVTERPKAGDRSTLKLDWGARYRRMRMHTALHLLSAVLPYPVTGGAVNEDDSRLDFDIPEAGLDKDEITAKVNEMIKADAEVRSRWITDDGAGSQSGARQNHVGEAADRHRQGAADRDRGLRPAALRRHACAPHRRDRRGARDADREKGQAEPPRADFIRLIPEDSNA